MLSLNKKLRQKSQNMPSSTSKLLNRPLKSTSQQHKPTKQKSKKNFQPIRSPNKDL